MVHKSQEQEENVMNITRHKIEDQLNRNAT